MQQLWQGKQRRGGGQGVRDASERFTIFFVPFGGCIAAAECAQHVTPTIAVGGGCARARTRRCAACRTALLSGAACSCQACVAAAHVALPTQALACGGAVVAHDAAAQPEACQIKNGWLRRYGAAAAGRGTCSDAGVQARRSVCRSQPQRTRCDIRRLPMRSRRVEAACKTRVTCGQPCGTQHRRG